MNIAILIPAYNPENSLLDLVENLVGFGFPHIVIVNDGSNPSCRDIFRTLENKQNYHVVHHAVNLGKGRALKSGINFCCLNFPDLHGILTADADGQHLAEDIHKIAKEFLQTPKSLLIGTRTFAKGTPFRSRLGNIVTRYIFKVLVGGNLSDTQSGLRCIPMGKAPELIRLEGERYEYEMNMLILAQKNRIHLREIPIATVYVDNNRSSHFNPLIDSMKIYFLLLRFALSSLLASSIDFLVFTATYLAWKNILGALVLARVVSGGVNFLVNKNLVFHDWENTIAPLIKYFALFVTLGVLSFLSIRTLADFGVNVIAAKLIAESVLFLGSFTIQRDFIFVGTSPELDR